MKQPIKKTAGQTVEEMAEQMMLTHENNRLYGNRKGNYKEISDQLKAEALSAAVDQQIAMMQRVRERGRVDLNNIEEVKATAEAYMQSCKISGSFPTMLGFAAACGYSRKHLYWYIGRNDNETSRYIGSLQSAWADILAQMGLTRQADSAVSIFLLKNCGQGLADKSEFEVTAVPASPLGHMQDAAELAKKYENIPLD